MKFTPADILRIALALIFSTICGVGMLVLFMIFVWGPSGDAVMTVVILSVFAIPLGTTLGLYVVPHKNDSPKFGLVFLSALIGSLFGWLSTYLTKELDPLAAFLLIVPSTAIGFFAFKYSRSTQTEPTSQPPKLQS
jgi:hypothetical protein